MDVTKHLSCHTINKKNSEFENYCKAPNAGYSDEQCFLLMDSYDI
jgi:hypothetical protein